MLLVFGALGAAGSAWQLFERDKKDGGKRAVGGAAALLRAAGMTFLTRPGFGHIEERGLVEDAGWDRVAFEKIHEWVDRPTLHITKFNGTGPNCCQFSVIFIWDMFGVQIVHCK